MKRRWGILILAAVAAGTMVPIAHAGPLDPVVPPCSATTDWPTFGHDVGRSFASPDTCISRLNAPTLRPKWFFDTKSPITAQPAVVGGVVYVGTFDGKFYAVNASDGTAAWAHPFDIKQYDNDITDFGAIPGSASVITLGGRKLVIFGGGGTIFAVNASDGTLFAKRCLDRVDETCQGLAGYTTEIESSPAVLVQQPGGNIAQVLVGTDVNEQSPSGPAGLVSLKLNADGFQPHWWFDPETGQTYDGLAPLQDKNHLTEHGCNDVWSSPAVDLSTETVSFGVGNCNQPVARDPQTLPKLVESTIAVDRLTGKLRWQYAPHAPDNGLDVDFGATPNVLAPGTVAEGGKDGYYYAYDSNTGALRWKVQVATGSSIGGIIATTATGKFSDGHQAVFADTAIPVSPADGQGSMQNNVMHPNQALGVHAIDATTHTVRWDAAAGPSYGAAVFSGGVVFVPDTFSNSLLVLDGDTGAVLRAQPMNVPPAGPVAVSGNSVYVGAGITESAPGLSSLAGFGGLWGFTTTP